MDKKEEKIINAGVCHNLEEKKCFSLISRIKSSNHAWRGLGILSKTDPSVWIGLICIFLAVYLGIILKMDTTEWAVIILTGGLVFVAEAFNTAIEIDIDLTSPNYHPYARDTKDMAAGAVSLTLIIAGLIGIVLYLPKIIALM